MELKCDPEAAYQSLQRTIESVNAVISTYNDEALGDLQFTPQSGTVLFGSGYYKFGFTLKQFADKIAAASKQDPAKILHKMWGDHYLDPETKKFQSVGVSPTGKPLERYVCKNVLGPIFKLARALLEDDWEVIDNLLKVFNVTLKAEEHELKGKELFRAAMKKFLPIGDALKEVIIDHIPPPVVAQKYRAEILYQGPMTDTNAVGIRDCNADGPLVVYISKMAPAVGKGFYAFGRVYSGTIRPGQKVYIWDPNSDKPKEKQIPGVLVMMGKVAQRMDCVPCGNTVAIMGIDDYLLKSGTLTSDPQACPIRPMKFSVSAVVKVAVAPKRAADLPKFVSGLKSLAKADPCVQYIQDQSSGENIVACAGDLHLEICLNQLRTVYCVGIEFSVSEPVVALRETVTTPSSVVCLKKTPNKHNRLFAKAQPLSESICAAIDSKKIDILEDSKERYKYLVEEDGWDSNEAKSKIWCFGPEAEPTNTVVDGTFGISYLNEIKDSMKAAFTWATNEGPLCGEPLRGVRFDLADVTLHADAIHRGGGQIIPAARELIYACVLTAAPRLMEPVFLVDIQTIDSMRGAVHNVLTKRRGRLVSEDTRPGTPILIMHAYLPVLESFGLTAALRESCHGQAFPQCVMDHWQLVPGDPLVPGTLANTIMMQVRARKNLAGAPKPAEAYLDKL
jgi:elongation factor 2